MFAYMTGIVAEKGHNELVIETGGIGYQLICSMNTVQNAGSVGESMRVYTYLNVRQDGLDLFGFESREEREMFLRLTGVSGIGPRTAIAILGSMPLRDLTLAILMGDTTALCRAPGIGKKTAERMLLELKDKVGAATGEVGSDFGESVAAGGSGAVAEAMEALASLGYSNSEIMPVLKQISDADKLSGEEVLRQALKLFAKR